MMSTGDWIAAVSAAATVVAVVAALFGPAVERRLRRPRLVLLAEPPAELGVAAKVVADARADGAVCYWLRLAVSNVGRTTADEVRLLLYRVDVEPPLAVQPPAREAKWADVPQDTLTLPPGITRLVDVLHVVRTRDRRGGRRHLPRGRPEKALMLPGTPSSSRVLIS